MQSIEINGKEISRQQLAQIYIEKWTLKQCMCVCVGVLQYLQHSAQKQHQDFNSQLFCWQVISHYQVFSSTGLVHSSVMINIISNPMTLAISVISATCDDKQHRKKHYLLIFNYSVICIALFLQSVAPMVCIRAAQNIRQRWSLPYSSESSHSLVLMERCSCPFHRSWASKCCGSVGSRPDYSQMLLSPIYICNYLFTICGGWKTKLMLVRSGSK